MEEANRDTICNANVGTAEGGFFVRRIGCGLLWLLSLFCMFLPCVEAAQEKAEAPRLRARGAAVEDGTSPYAAYEGRSAGREEASEEKEPSALQTAASAQEAAAPEPDEAASSESGRTEAKERYPKFELSGEYRWLFGEGRMELPEAHRKEKTLLATRRLRLFPLLHLDKEWSLRTQLEDIRYDKDPAGTPHKSDRRLYLSRLYIEHTTRHATKLSVGRFNFMALDGNAFDRRVEGVRYRFGDGVKVGRASVFYGRTVAREAGKRKRGLILSYEQRRQKWQGGVYYFDLKSEAAPLTLQEARKKPLSLGNAFDRQRALEMYASYRFDKHRSLSLEWLHGWARTELDGWTGRGDGFVATLHLRQPPDLERPGDYGLWISYYHQPRATFIAHTMDADPTFFGRAGFCGWGARADIVLARGLVLAIEGFDLKPAQPETPLFGPISYRGARQRVLGMSATAYF